MKMNTERFYVIGRVLLGLYFIVPGLMKITGFSATAAYMSSHGMPLVPMFLVLAILAEVGGGLALVFNYRTSLVALALAALVVVINVVLHDFWTLEDGLQRGHELQNFIKNTAIMAGLLVLAGTAGQDKEVD